jgi:hypothetical protein
VGLDKIKYIKSYSANSIAELTNEQIQEIVDYGISSEKTNDHVREIPETARPGKFLPEVSEVNASHPTPTPQTTSAKTVEYDEPDSDFDPDYDEAMKQAKILDEQKSTTEVSHAPIKISKFPEDREIIIEALLKRFPFLSWTRSITWYRDAFEYTDPEAICPAHNRSRTRLDIQYGKIGLAETKTITIIQCVPGIHIRKRKL